MKLISVTCCIASLCAAGLTAQTRTTTTQTDEKQKVEIKDGKKTTVLGCLERNPGGGYMLTSAETGGMKYALVTDKDLSKHLGERVEVRGKATDRGDAKVKLETEVATSGSGAGDNKITDKVTRELKGDLGLHYLGVDSVKTMAASCR